MKYEKPLIFLLGLTGGGIAGYFLGRQLTLKSVERMMDNNVNKIEDVVQDASKLEKADYNDSGNKDISGKTSNNTWTDADRECTANILKEQEYLSKDEASESVDGELCVVNEPDLISEEEAAEKASKVEVISAVEFAKGVAKGGMLKSFLYCPVDSNFYWNFTEEPLTYGEVDQLFGRDVLNDILEESSINASGWIQPRCLYNASEDCYIRIETKFKP